MTDHPPNLTFTPALSTYRNYVVSILGVVGVLFVLALITFRGHVLQLVIWLAVGGAVVAALVTLYFRNTAFSVDGDSLVWRDMFRRSHRYPRSDLGRSVLVLRLEQPTGRTTIELSRLFVLDSTGKSVVTWVSSAWTVAQMRSLVAALGVRLDEIADPITPPELRKRYPRALNLFQARPYFVGFLIAMGLLVILAIVVVIALARS